MVDVKPRSIQRHRETRQKHTLSTGVSLLRFRYSHSPPLSRLHLNHRCHLPPNPLPI
ncbi:hypothetical protein BDZ97DRAFT_1806767, partial [Flammula alnicola]